MDHSPRQLRIRVRRQAPGLDPEDAAVMSTREPILNL